MQWKKKLSIIPHQPCWVSITKKVVSCNLCPMPSSSQLAVLLPTFALEKLAAGLLKVPGCHFLLQSVTDDCKWKKNGLLYNSVQQQELQTNSFVQESPIDVNNHGPPLKFFMFQKLLGFQG